MVMFSNYHLETYSLSADDNQTAFQSYLVYSMMVSVDIQPLSDDPETVQGCAILLSNTQSDDITGTSSFIFPRSVACCVLNVDDITLCLLHVCMCYYYVNLVENDNTICSIQYCMYVTMVFSYAIEPAFSLL